MTEATSDKPGAVPRVSRYCVAPGLAVQANVLWLLVRSEFGAGAIIVAAAGATIFNSALVSRVVVGVDACSVMLLSARGVFPVVIMNAADPDPVIVREDGLATAPVGRPDGVIVTTPPKPCDLLNNDLN